MVLGIGKFGLKGIIIGPLLVCMIKTIYDVIIQYFYPKVQQIYPDKTTAANKESKKINQTPSKQPENQPFGEYSMKNLAESTPKPQKQAAELDSKKDQTG